MSTKQKKRTVVEAAVKVLRLEDLQVDPSYQRDVKTKHKKIVAEFDRDALGVIQVGERADGSLWIVDGLQRVTALKKLGYKEVRANVFASRGPEHEAEEFKLINLNRAKLRSTEEFRALLTSHDPTAWAVKETAEAVGYKITLGKTGRGGGGADELTCVNTMMRIVKSGGTPPLKFALQAAKVCWPGDRLGVYNLVIDGLATFFRRLEGAVDVPRFHARLTTTPPQKLIYSANQMTVSGNKSAIIADLLEKVYKKRISGRRGD